MLEVLNKCFPQYIQEWEPKIKEMIPSYGLSLMDNPVLLQKIHTTTADTLGLGGKEHVFNQKVF